jgi:hypothetical protein
VPRSATKPKTTSRIAGPSEEGDAALRVHAPVDRVNDDHEAFGDLAEPPLAELLRHEREVDAVGVKRFEAGHNGSLRRLVDCSRLVSALAGSNARLPLGPRRQAGDDTPNSIRGLPADGEPVGHSSKGEKRRPLVSFGKK